MHDSADNAWTQMCRFMYKLAQIWNDVIRIFYVRSKTDEVTTRNTTAYFLAHSVDRYARLRAVLVTVPTVMQNSPFLSYSGGHKGEGLGGTPLPSQKSALLHCLPKRSFC